MSGLMHSVRAGPVGRGGVPARVWSRPASASGKAHHPARKFNTCPYKSGRAEVEATNAFFRRPLDSARPSPPDGMLAFRALVQQCIRVRRAFEKRFIAMMINIHDVPLNSCPSITIFFAHGSQTSPCLIFTWTMMVRPMGRPSASLFLVNVYSRSFLIL